MGASALHSFGVVETQLGNHATARCHFERIRQITVEVADLIGEGMALMNLLYLAPR